MDVESEVESILFRARVEVDLLADRYREQVLLPFCRKHRLTYVSGNGCSNFYDGHSKPVYDWENPALLEVTRDLNVSVLGAIDVFGFYVPDVSAEDILTGRSKTPRTRKAGAR